MGLTDHFWMLLVRKQIAPDEAALTLRLPVEVVRGEMDRVTGRMPATSFVWEETCRQLRSTWRG